MPMGGSDSMATWTSSKKQRAMMGGGVIWAEFMFGRFDKASVVGSHWIYGGEAGPKQK